MNIQLKDPSNRDEDGAAFMLVGSADRVIAYLDGPVRRDTREASHFYIDTTIDCLHFNNLNAASKLAHAVGIYLTEHIGELPEVTDLGEDFDQWLVTGTTDAHSAEEAVRRYWATILDGDDANDMFDDYEPGGLGLEHRTDWAWKHRAGTPLDAEPDDTSELVSGANAHGLPRFAGYMVTL